MLFVIYIRDINFSMNCTYITQNMVPERCYFNALILKKNELLDVQDPAVENFIY